MRFAEVSHKTKEFVRKKGQKVRVGGKVLSNMAGTQSIDSRWKLLDKYVPREQKMRKMCDDGRKGPNQDLMIYARSWQWRQWRHSDDLFVELGAGMKMLAAM